MSSSVWVAATGQVAGAAHGDIVVTPDGDLVRVAEVAGDGTVTPRAEVKADLLPHLPAGEEPQRVEDEALLRALLGVLEAERDRGA